MLAIAMAVVAALVGILMTGGESGADQTGDLHYVEGKQPRGAPGAPIAASMADIVAADVHRNDSQVVFQVTVAATIPKEFKRSSLEFRFDIAEDGRNTWIVTATVNVAASAAVVSQVTDYGSSTIDDTMPGSVEISGETITITLESQTIENFPATFDWALSSNLIAFRDIAGSTRVEDRFPDEGSISGP